MSSRRFFWSAILFRLIILVGGFLFVDAAFAITQPTIGQVSKNINTGIVGFATILQDIALICGVGFILASFFKFHQHKLNPTQVPMSQGVTLLIIGAGLTVFPHLLNTVSKGVFGTTAEKLGSTDIKSVLSAS